MSASIKARFDDPYGVQEPHAIDVKGSGFGLVAFQQGGPSDVAVMVGSSPRNYLDLLHGIVRWGVESEISREAIMATVLKATVTP